MNLAPELAWWKERIETFARDHGLDFFETRFEVVSAKSLNEVAAYGGFPTRYPHWRFGMAYEQLAKGYEWGLSKIYELVINNDPCYAYLMSSNPLVDQKMVMAHVYGHCDFFKNNYYFSFTNRKMVDEMANHATKVRRIIDRIGLDKVEEFLDVALSVENLIDHMAPYVARAGELAAPEETSFEPARLPAAKDYMEGFINPPDYLARKRGEIEDENENNKIGLDTPVRDVLGFLIERAPLDDWQIEILEIVRAEAYYFNPQGMTKIMNEGWATYWHQKMMTEQILEDSEVIDYAETMAGTLSGDGLNPYQLGLALYHDIEERWNNGRHGIDYDRCDDLDTKKHWDTGAMAGRDKIFEVRRHHCDVTFVDEFMTTEFCEHQRLFVHGWNPRNQRHEILSRQIDEVKAQILRQITNGGHPIIDVVDDNHLNRGELRLEHRWEETELRDDYARETLTNIGRIWSRPVLLETRVDGRVVTYRADGEEVAVEEA